MTMFKQTSPENALIIEKLAAALAVVPIGDTISYHSLKERAPGFRDGGHSWVLRKARESAEQNLGCAFECVRGVGVKRLTSSEIPGVGLSAIRKIRRGANRGKKRLDRVNINNFTQLEQRRVVGMSAMLGAISMIADGRKATSIATVADPVKPIPPQNILDMFRA
jgi:hypothetical protein